MTNCTRTEPRRTALSRRLRGGGGNGDGLGTSRLRGFALPCQWQCKQQPLPWLPGREGAGAASQVWPQTPCRGRRWPQDWEGGAGACSRRGAQVHYEPGISLCPSKRAQSTHSQVVPGRVLSRPCPCPCRGEAPHCDPRRVWGGFLLFD